MAIRRALSATLNVADNAAGSPQQVSVSATVINPVGSLSPTGLHFGTVAVGSSRSQNVTLTNTGTTELDITSIGAAGADAGDFGVNDSACPSSLGAGDNCVIEVTFTPSTTGTRTAVLAVVDNAQVRKQQAPLSGTGH